jgi:DNA-binding CsgD family transcriptional regulator
MAELLERERAGVEIERALAAARDGRGASVLVHGPPGSGRTALLEQAAAVAADAGLAVRTWAAAADEAGEPHAAVRALLGDLIAPGGVDAPAGWSETIALVAAHGPVVLLLDDAERADEPSLRVLGALARRAAEAPLVLVVATDDGPPGAPVRRMLDGAPRSRDVLLRPLSEAASVALVRAVAPGAPAAAGRACHAAGAGLPRYVTALAADLPGGGEPGAGCPAPLVRRLADRLASLDPEAIALARALAILGAGATWARAGRLAGLDGPQRRAAADVLRVAALVDRGAEPAFVARVVGAGVRAAVPPGAAASLHRAAAELLAGEDAPAEDVAAHLVACEPDGDPWAWRMLVAAGREAMDRRAPDVAVGLLLRALAEPPARDDRAAVLIDLGIAESAAFRNDVAVVHLRAAVAAAGSLEERLEASLALVAVLTQAGDPERDLGAVLDALTEVDDRRLREQLEAHVVNQARQHTSAHRATRAVAQAVAARVAADPDDASAAELAAAAAELTMAGERADDVAALAAAALQRTPDPEPLRSTTVPVAIRCLATADHLDAAARYVEAALAASRARDASLEVTMLSAFGADVAWRAGDLAAAERLARDAWSGGTRESWSLGHPATTAGLVTVLLDRGAPAEAEAVLATAGFAGSAEPGLDLYTGAMLLHARGRLHLALGATAAAVADLRASGRRLDAHGEPNPALIAWRSPLALALGGAEGRALADEELRLARGYGAARAIGIALRARALLEPEPAGRVPLLREAVATLADSPGRLEHARALADLGEALLATGTRDAAREVLHDAYELAHRCGAAGIAAQAAAALREAGARPRRPFRRGPQSLTARERRVCELARDGLTNRAIAELLVVTVSTVEYHLAAAYRKLGIASRRELAAALNDTAPAGSAPDGRVDRVVADPADGRAVPHPAAELHRLPADGPELDAEAPVAERMGGPAVDDPLDPLAGRGDDHQLE